MWCILPDVNLVHMLAFDHDGSAGLVKVWLDDGRGSELSSVATLPVSAFQSILREFRAVDDGNRKVVWVNRSRDGDGSHRGECSAVGSSWY